MISADYLRLSNSDCGGGFFSELRIESGEFRNFTRLRDESSLFLENVYGRVSQIDK
jgi:hypothetical protein